MLLLIKIIFLGVIKGWSVNQDGTTNGITAPSVKSQIILERSLYKKFAINPEHINLIEAHGTGTKIGDQIEFEALTSSFQQHTSKTSFCALGSVKSNIGHALAASGISGVIKIINAIQNKKIPPTINYENINSHIGLKKSPFYISSKLHKWERIDGKPRTAAVSSFGFSGTNAHLVLEEYTRTDTHTDTDMPALIILSAKTQSSFAEYIKKLLSFVANDSKVNIHDLAYTLQVGREAMEHRIAVQVDSVMQLQEILNKYIECPYSIIEDLYIGQVKTNKDTLSVFNADEDMMLTINAWIKHGKYNKLLELWVKRLQL